MSPQKAFDIVRCLKRESVGRLLCASQTSKNNEFKLYTLENAVKEADIILILVDYKSFKKLKASDLHEKVIVDTRGMLKGCELVRQH